MALVGEAHIIVRAITSGVERDIRNGFQNIEGTGTEAGKRLGKSYGTGFLQGYRSSNGNTVFKRLGDAFRAVENDAENARRTLSRMVELGYVLGPALYAALGAISAVVVGLGLLAAAALGAASSLAAVGAAAISLGVGFKVAGMALKGVGAAVNQAGGSTSRYTKTLKEMREELQQLRFDAEEAAIGEKEAALNLEKARLNLLRMQDLPPNSIARREAEIEYERAEFAYRKAKDRRQDLQEEAAKGIKGIKEQNKAAAAGADPYSKLTPSQKKFVDYLRTIQGQFKALRETAAAGFLGPLQTSIEMFMSKAFPNLQKGVGQIATAMGNAAVEFATVFTTDANQEQFSLAMKNISTNITGMGTTFGNFGAGFTRFFNLSQPLTERFNKWVSGIATTFDQWTIDEADNIQDFLKRAGDAAAILGDIFSNVFGGIGGIINEALQPDGGGIGLLEWLRDATAGFKNIGNDPALAGFLSQAGETAKQVFSIIGKIFTAFIKLAGDPNVTEFFKKINDNFPNIQKAIDAISDALPVVADVFNNLIEIFAEIASSPATKFFFDTLKVLTDILKPAAKFLAWALVIVGPLFAIFKAVARVGSVLKFLGLAVLGTFNAIKRFFGFFKKGAETTKKSTEAMNKGVKQTEKDVKKMTKATGLAEKAFKTMNTALQKLNTTLKTFGERTRTAASSLTKVKDSASKANTPMKKLKDETGKTADKFKKVKTEGDKAKKSLDNIRTSAQKARTELGKLGKTKTAPSVGAGGGAGMGAGMRGGGAAGSAGGGFLGGLVGGKTAAMLKSPLGKAGLIGGAIAIGGGMVADMVSPYIDMANASRASTKQLEILARTNGKFGGSAKKVAEDLDKVASNMSAVTGAGKEEIKGIQALLFKYPELAASADQLNGPFQRVTDYSLDLSRVLGIDAPSAAVLMADSLRNPEEALANLEAAGVTFTEQEKKKYEQMLLSNDSAGAQDFLLKTLGERYGNVAEETATASDKINSKWNQVGEKFGKILQPISDALAAGALNFLNWVGTLFGIEEQKMPSSVTAPGGSKYVKVDGSAALGATVYPKRGGVLMQVAEAGRPERIEPLDPNGISNRDKAIIRELSMAAGGGGGVNITVNAAPGMDEREIANIVSRKLAFQLRKGGF